KGESFGALAARPDGTFDASGVRGVSPDLVVRPFGWKGNVTTLRDFCRGAARDELGMEADELVYKVAGTADADLDGDGVPHELTVGDVTAITVYCAALSIPHTLDQAAADGTRPKPTAAASAQVARGRALFTSAGCSACHTPSLHLADVVYEEPTRRGGGNYLDPDLVAMPGGPDPDHPARFDLVAQGDPPRLVADPAGGASA
ncbi:MAG TPA: di-heme oxidoredictase family protein, partial [Planctomycetota bacterium]|nr:di-heme oxidoredictase family protein [Planctomycetota bacterium]